MAVVHRRVDGSGFFLRGRIQGNWITWQLNRDGQQWLRKHGFGDGDTIDMELLEMFVDKNWAYTAGTGAGVGADGDFRPSFIRVGEGVKHEVFGVGEIRELLPNDQSRATFFREYPNTRSVPNGELSPAKSIELARERSIAYTKHAARSKAPAASTPLAHQAAPRDDGVVVGRPSPTLSPERPFKIPRWLIVVVGILILLVLLRAL
jgi:hypothetical protein